jgi:hypothetical protein
MNGYGVRRQAKRDAAFVLKESGVALRLAPHSIISFPTFN